MKKTWIVKKED